MFTLPPASSPRCYEGFARYTHKAAQYLTLLLPLLVPVGKAPVDIACSLVGVLFLVTHILRRDFAWLETPWIRVALVFWGYLFLRALFSDDIGLALERAAPWGRYPFFAFALACWVITDRDFSRKLLIATAIACLLIAADTMVQFLTGLSTTGNEKFRIDRLTGPFSKPRIGHTLAWMLFPVLLSCLHVQREKWGWSLLKIMAAGMLCFVVIASGERAPTLLMLLGIGLAGLLVPALRRNLLWLVPLGAGAIALFLYLNPVMYERHVKQTHKHMVERLWTSPYGKILRDSGRLFVENPVFGIGIQHYRVATAKGGDALEQGQLHPHNFYVEISVEAGLVGLVGLLALFGSWIGSFIRHFRLWYGDYLLTGLVIGIAIRLWPITFGPSFYASWNVIPLWLMVGWYFAVLRQRQEAASSLQPTR